MRSSLLSPRAAALVDLRQARRWSSSRLAREAGVALDTISRYETGKVPLDEERLLWLGRVMEYSREEVLLAVQLAERRMRGTVEPAHPLVPGRQDQQALGAKAASIALRFEPLVYRALENDWTRKRIEEDHRRAVALIEALEGLTSEERRGRIEGDPDYRLWALTPELGERSVRAVGGSVEKAAEWAALARLAAESAEVPGSWRPRLRACGLFFAANVERVGNGLRDSEKTFVCAWSEWGEGAPEGLPLGEWRFLDLEASLRCDQRRWEDAVGLLQRAITLAPPEIVPRLQVSLAIRFNEMAEPARALQILQAARETVEASSDSRLQLTLSFHLATSLFELGRTQEAALHASEARERARAGEWWIDELRSGWLAGRIDWALGRIGVARLTLGSVRERFTELRLALDAALVGLDEALLLLEGQAHAEVKDLATDLILTLRSGQLTTEALAALRVFYSAARREEATVELARLTQEKLRAFLKRPNSLGAG